MAEQLVPEHSASEVQMAIERWKTHTSLLKNQIPTELMQAGDSSETHKLISCIWSTEELPQQWKQSFTVPIYEGDETD